MEETKAVNDQLATYLEDYEDFMSLTSLCTADDISLLSIDISNPEPSMNLTSEISESREIHKDRTKDLRVDDKDDKIVKTSPQVSCVPVYRGLTAQIGSIPSISCDNSLVLEDDEPLELVKR